MDKQIGRNLARLRGDVTQDELAKRMKELGFKWSQSTVWSIERGDRPLRLAEASALDHVLGKIVSSVLTWGEPEAQVQAQQGKVHDEWNRLVDAAASFKESQMQYAFAAYKAGGMSEVMQGIVLDWLRHGLDTVADELRKRSLKEVSDAAIEDGMTVEEYLAGMDEAPGERLDGPYFDAYNETWKAVDGEHPEAS